MKILWLCSWYPQSADPFDGDFIERQAKALSMYHDVQVIHVVQNFQFLLYNYFLWFYVSKRHSKK